jgi:hypothetical protein
VVVVVVVAEGSTHQQEVTKIHGLTATAGFDQMWRSQLQQGPVG